MGCGLVGHHIGDDAALGDFRIDIGGIADKADRQRAALGLRGGDHLQRRIEIGGDHFEITDLLALARAFRIDVNGEDRGTGHAACERLRTAHATEPGGQHEAPSEGAAEATFGDAHEDLVGALNDALRADILPGAGRESAPADQALALEFVEDLGLRPLARRCCNSP